MSGDMGLKLNSELNLRSLTVRKMAIGIWETPAIKKEIQKFGVEIRSKDVASAYNDSEPWLKICKKALKQVQSSDLPANLKNDLEKMVLFIGDQIFIWTVYVVKEFVLDVKFAQKILWTSNGLIDEKRIYYEVWKNDPYFPGIPNYWTNKVALYSIACIHTDEELLRQNLKEVAQVVVAYTGVKIKDLNKFKLNSAMTTLLIKYFVSKAHTLNFDLLYLTLKSPQYPTGADKMFYYCAIYGFEAAAEYFYKKLKPDHKDNLVFAALSECVNMADQKINFNFEKSRLPGAVLYLLDKIPQETKRMFLIARLEDVFTFFYGTWPYQDLCIPLLDSVWSVLSQYPKKLVLDRALEIYKKYSDTRHSVYKSILNPTLKWIIKRVPDPKNVDLLNESFEGDLKV